MTVVNEVKKQTEKNMANSQNEIKDAELELKKTQLDLD